MTERLLLVGFVFTFEGGSRHGRNVLAVGTQVRPTFDDLESLVLMNVQMTCPSATDATLLSLSDVTNILDYPEPSSCPENPPKPKQPN